jgi:hypothetical protein
MRSDQGADAGLLIESYSRHFLTQILKESLLSIFRQEPEEPRHRKQQSFRIFVAQVGAARKSAQIISRQWPRDRSVPSISAAVSMARSMTGV